MPIYKKGKMTGMKKGYGNTKQYMEFERKRNAEIAELRGMDSRAMSGKKTGNPHSKMGKMSY